MRDALGSVVADRYELRERLGAGGSGAVYRAHDRVLGRDVAIKRMHPGIDEDARARLRVEARLTGLLAHPGLARLHDFGEEPGDPSGGGPTPYLVMEYVDGVPLRDVLRAEGPVAPDRVMGIVAELADALAVAHAAGIVHRDVKPGNVLVRPDGTVALIDFGIARAADVEPLTLTGTIVGTVDYISPEQAGGGGATPASDLYALGLIAYECLTGIRPLRRDTQLATLLAHVNEDVPALPATFAAPVRDLVRRLSDRDPGRRPADAATVAAMARAAIGAVPGPESAEASTGRIDIPPRAGRRPRRRRWAAAGLAAAVLAGGWLVLTQTGAPDAPAAAQADAAAAPTTRVPVDRLVGRSYADAARLLRSLGLAPRPVGGTPAPDAVVIRVSPHGRLADGATVRVWVQPTAAAATPSAGAASTSSRPRVAAPPPERRGRGRAGAATPAQGASAAAPTPTATAVVPSAPSSPTEVATTAPTPGARPSTGPGTGNGGGNGNGGGHGGGKGPRGAATTP